MFCGNFLLFSSLFRLLQDTSDPHVTQPWGLNKKNISRISIFSFLVENMQGAEMQKKVGECNYCF